MCFADLIKGVVSDVEENATVSERAEQGTQNEFMFMYANKNDLTALYGHILIFTDNY